MPRGVDTYLTPFGLLWTERTGGEPPYSRMAPALAPLIKAHGADAVVASWKNYLAKEDPKFLSPQAFAQKYGIYAGTNVAALSPAEQTKLAVAEWFYAGDAEDPFRRALANGLVRLGRGLTKALTAADVPAYAEECAGMAPEALEAAFATLKASSSVWWPSPAAVAQASRPSETELRAEALAIIERVGNPFWYAPHTPFDPEVVRERLGGTAYNAFRAVDMYRRWTTWDDTQKYHWVTVKSFREAYIELVQGGAPRAKAERLALTGAECEADVQKQLGSGHAPAR